MLKPGINLKLGVPLAGDRLRRSRALGAVRRRSASRRGRSVRGQRCVSNGGGAAPGPGPVTVTIVAEGIVFDLSTLTANAGSEFNVVLDNRDGGVLHNVAFYHGPQRRASSSSAASCSPGPAIQESTFTAPVSGGDVLLPLRRPPRHHDGRVRRPVGSRTQAALRPRRSATLGARHCRLARRGWSHGPAIVPVASSRKTGPWQRSQRRRVPGLTSGPLVAGPRVRSPSPSAVACRLPDDLAADVPAEVALHVRHHVVDHLSRH